MSRPFLRGKHFAEIFPAAALVFLSGADRFARLFHGGKTILLPMLSADPEWKVLHLGPGLKSSIVHICIEKIQVLLRIALQSCRRSQQR